MTARLVGEIHELLALDLEEHEYVIGAAELGMEMEPPAPLSVSRWLETLADGLATPRPDYGQGG